MNIEMCNSQFKEVGKLSSYLPSYVRHCCRSFYDGTDDSVLDTFRVISISALRTYRSEYPFVQKHISILSEYDAVRMKKLICDNPYPIACLMSGTHQGLPKRACLHCQKIGRWIRILREEPEPEFKKTHEQPSDDDPRRMKKGEYFEA